MNKKFAIGVDIGGSHITSAIIDLESKNIFQSSHSRMRVNAHGTSENIIDVWTESIQTSIDHIGKDHIIGVGIAMPGPFDYDLGVSFIKGQNKYDELYGLNVKNMLAASLEISTDRIRFMNDAACFLKGEAFCGAAEGAKSAIGFTLGTGLGSAYYFNEKAEDAQLWCSRFRDNIAEDYISARWFVRRYQELSGREIVDVKALADLVDTDGTAFMVFSEFGETLSEFMMPILMDKKPEYVVIGGNIANGWNLFINKLQDDVHQQLPDIKIVKAQLSEEAALIGAASLFL